MGSHQIVPAILLSVIMLPMAYFLFAIGKATWLAVEPLSWEPYRRWLRRNREAGSLILESWFWFLMVWGTMAFVVFAVIIP